MNNHSFKFATMRFSGTILINHFFKDSSLQYRLSTSDILKSGVDNL